MATDGTHQVNRIKGGFGELRVVVDGVDVVDTGLLGYPTPSSVVAKVEHHLASKR